MFWALSLEPNEQYKQNFATDLHISGAVLDVESLSANSKKGVQVWVEYESKQHLITNLGRQTPQFTLDIGFSKGERVTFFTKGPGNVHLHGYFVPDDDVENEKLENDEANASDDSNEVDDNMDNGQSEPSKSLTEDDHDLTEWNGNSSDAMKFPAPSFEEYFRSHMWPPHPYAANSLAKMHKNHTEGNLSNAAATSVPTIDPRAIKKSIKPLPSQIRHAAMTYTNPYMTNFAGSQFYNPFQGDGSAVFTLNMANKQVSQVSKMPPKRQRVTTPKMKELVNSNKKHKSDNQ